MEEYVKYGTLLKRTQSFFGYFSVFFCDGRVGDGTKINNMILVFGWFLNSLCLGRNILLNIGPSAGCFQMSFSAVLRES